MSDVVLVERRDGLQIITINRPDQRNAVNRAVSDAVCAAIDELESTPELKLAIITGAGGTFCAGMDLKAFVSGEDVMSPDRGFGGITSRPPRKPLIAAIEGWALAGGTEIALAADMIVAAEDAQLGIPEVKRGLVAGAGGLLRMPGKIPLNLAYELALTGDPLSAKAAHAIGLVNALTPKGGALDGALALAARITPNGPLALAATKKVLDFAAEHTVDEGWALQLEVLPTIFASNDAREGATAFAEKRPPKWTAT
ncbi:MAG TPA: crotonase/enoyl-CoA hydratase family protein [Mycobacteriales bacterium]|nr:crotonase/enoyl-CoA hydratase family protein [Mycobacteriales bacterium]